jgi:ABC-2 type transport system permease protein
VNAPFAASGTLTRFALRRDRVVLGICALAVVVLTALAIPTFTSTYATEIARRQRAGLIRTPVGVIFGGPGYGLADYRVGPMLVNELVPLLVVALILVNIIVMVRHTRTEEQTGRAELVRASSVGRRAPITAALATCAAADLAIGLLVALTAVRGGLPVADSLAVGVGMALTGLAFAAMAAVFAQIAEYSRSAISLSVLTFAVVYIVRIIGDIARPGGTALSWVSPTSWLFQTRPYVDLRWWPLVLYIPTVALLAALAFTLAARRDVGAGLMRARRGPDAASPRLSGMFALSRRLLRGPMIGWTVAAVLLGLFYGSLGSQVTGMVAANPAAVTAVGGDPNNIVSGFLATMLVYVSVLASVLGIICASRLRAEEAAGRAELAMSTATSRLRWMGTGLGVALLAGTVVQVLGALFLGLSAGASLQDPSLVGQLTLASLNYLPIPLVFIAIATLLLGLAPRLFALTWVVFAVSVFVTLFSGFGHMPRWVTSLSVFNLPALVPLESVDGLALAAMLAAAFLAAAGGLFAFNRRDVGFSG